MNFLKTQKDYILEYVSRIDALLAASLSREDMADEDKYCRHCDKGTWAVWRCRDCSMGMPMCRGCIRRSHKENPFHRIEHWNGQFFRPADHWEVGTYLLVSHHNRKLSCDMIKKQEDFLELIEEKNDVAEQNKLKVMPGAHFKSTDKSGRASSSATTSGTSLTSAHSSGTPPTSAHSSTQNDVPNTQPEGGLDDIEMSNVDPGAEDVEDEKFLRYLQKLRDGDDGRDLDEDTFEVDDDVEDDIDDPDPEVPIQNHYLPDIGTAQRVVGTYVRVVHTNGIHNIAMISCECQGPDHLPNDLLASRLLPTSFERIRTIFSAQLLDYFRLSNLETKASAYHFYHLLQRLTTPMDPNSVVNLYREFRRMSRIWRWMKRLKWAGYGNKNNMASDVSPGQLSVFCPACPQPGINIPENWKDDNARY
jgi:hypothetical protein